MRNGSGLGALGNEGVLGPGTAPAAPALGGQRGRDAPSLSGLSERGLFPLELPPLVSSSRVAALFRNGLSLEKVPSASSVPRTQRSAQVSEALAPERLQLEGHECPTTALSVVVLHATWSSIFGSF